MGAIRFGAVSFLLVLLACGCGGRATQGATQSVGASGGANAVADDDSGSFAGAPSTPPSAPSDEGVMSHCAGVTSASCSFTPIDRPDLPAAQRWGTLEGSGQFSVECPPTACGDAMFEVDSAGCVTAAADNIQSEFSACVLKYLEQFSWPCAAHQRVRFYLSCTTK